MLLRKCLPKNPSNSPSLQSQLQPLILSTEIIPSVVFDLEPSYVSLPLPPPLASPPHPHPSSPTPPSSQTSSIPCPPPPPPPPPLLILIPLLHPPPPRSPPQSTDLRLHPSHLRSLNPPHHPLPQSISL